MTMITQYVRVCIVVASFCLAPALDNGLASKPYMGWSSWNKFRCKIGNGTDDLSETTILQIADALIDSALRAVGYSFVNLDDCYMAKKRVNGRIVAGPSFPSGMRALGDALHARGFSFGVYLDCGTKTCQSFPGSAGYEHVDAATIAEWGADYLKYDECFSTLTEEMHRFFDMRDALNATGRPIVYEICPIQSRCNGNTDDDDRDFWDASSVANANMCRGDAFTGSLFCGKENCGRLSSYKDRVSWNAAAPDDIAANWCSFNCLLDANIAFDAGRVAGPGHWIQSDMLEVGNGMKANEDEAHFTLWCMMAFPLILGHDVRRQSPDTLRILSNTELIAVSQDSMGKPARLVGGVSSVKQLSQVYVRQLTNGDYAVALFNRNDEYSVSITLHWRDMDMPTKQPLKIRDLWKHKDVGIHFENFTTRVASHSVVALRVSQLPLTSIAQFV